MNDVKLNYNEELNEDIDPVKILADITQNGQLKIVEILITQEFLSAVKNENDDRTSLNQNLWSIEHLIETKINQLNMSMPDSITINETDIEMFKEISS